MNAPRGAALLQEATLTPVDAGSFALWWLGQHGFLIKAGGQLICLDAYLSPNPRRLVPPAFSPQEATGIDLVIGTHDHCDHIDRGAWPLLAQASPGARFAVPGMLKEKISRETDVPLHRFVELDEGVRVDLGGLQITPIASAHEFLDQDPRTGRFPHLGVVLEAGGCAIYHSGDCCLYAGLEAKLKKWDFSAVLLPINGRSGGQLRRGIIGNMTYQEAVDLAGSLGAKIAVPTHFDMFEGNTGDPEAFLDYLAVKYPTVMGKRPVHGEWMRIPPP
ncbi:MAG: MBL fold metallo-hydrolase [Spirochaetes bacterium]|nr:MBL fold metallo-hydrolase [Spirochaetota bacterium]